MVNLYIDGTPVVLPADFATEIKVENSFFTKSGEYTYDIKLPLDNPTNAALYAHLQRVNSLAEITEKRSAVLVADNRCYINGTEIITDWTEDSVSIQLASGNSELNYLIGADLQISTLDLGEVETGYIDESGNRVSTYDACLYANYPEFDFVTAPVSTPTGILNERQFYKSTAEDTYELRSVLFSSSVYHPYLCAMVRRLLTALGYTIGVNQLESSNYTQLLILHDVNTLEYAKMLPGWSVKDFFENLERLFNLVLVVNNKKKTVSIVFANQFYIEAEEVHLNEVEDDYEVEIDEDNAGLMTNGNIIYELPDTDYFKYASMNEDLVNICEKVEMVSLVLIGQHFKENTPTRTIGVDTSTGREYIYRPYTLETFMAGYYPLREVNQYAPLIRGGEDVPIKFIPSAQIYYGIEGYVGEEHVNDYIWTIPSLDGNTSSETEDVSSMNMDELIAKGSSVKNDSGSGRLTLAFWHGLHQTNNLGPDLPAAYPLVLADSQFQVWIDELQMAPFSLVDPIYSLRLPVLNDNLYSGVYDIDTTKSYTFYTSDPNLPDAHLIFVIRNKRFVCRDMTFTIANGQKQKRWKLVCYPIEISDTEAYKRWILTDGRWRDGGVWLDSGRWLDSL